MPTLINIVNKSYASLLKQLIADLKEGDLDKIYFLQYLTEAKVSYAEKQRIRESITNFVHYCREKREADNNLLFIYGHMLQFKIGGKLDYEEAVRIYDGLIAQGNPWAMNNRALMHEEGQDGFVDYEAAITLYEQAIARGNPAAMNNRACMYEGGRGGEVNFKEAASLYNLSIKTMINPWAMDNLAWMNLYARGEPDDVEAAINLYEQAITTFGYARAMYNRGKMHLAGTGGAVDILKAARLFRRSADNNHAAAVTQLSDSTLPIFKYHYFAHANEIEALVELLLKEPYAMEEFTTFECGLYLQTNKIDPVLLIRRITDSFYSKCSNTELVSRLYCSVLIQLDMSTHVEEHDLQWLLFKQHCLKQLSITHIKDDDVMPIIKVVIETWYASSLFCQETIDKWTQDTMSILTRALYRIRAAGREKECQKDLPNIILILGKSKYGKDYDFFLDQFNLTIEDILEIKLPSPRETQVKNRNRLFHKGAPPSEPLLCKCEDALKIHM